MSEYTVFRLVAIKVNADTREEAIKATKDWSGENACYTFDSCFEWDRKSQLISAIRTAESFYDEKGDCKGLKL